ncbi:hypothetical protein MTO96_008352 [Rhipicephalus appendiculatus]
MGCNLDQNPVSVRLPERVPLARASCSARSKAEIKFLRKLWKTPEGIKEEHLRCTNLAYLSAVVTCSLAVTGLVDVLKPFSLPEIDAECERQRRCADRTVVDVVANHGAAWIKVVARNPEALLTSSLGDGEYGRRTILDQLQDMVECAGCHPHLYKAPEVKVWTVLPVCKPLREIIQAVGAEVLNHEDVLSACDEETPEAAAEDSEASADDCAENFTALKLHEVPKDAVLNLDVSTMIACASALTNGRCHFRFRENVLTEQAESERRNPVRPALDELFADRKLVCCQSAYDDFSTIVKVMAGPCETEAAHRLLNDSRKRSKIIFGTGDRLKAVTVTANSGFLRAAKAQGADFVAFVHESRALTEAKEVNATPI